MHRLHCVAGWYCWFPSRRVICKRPSGRLNFCLGGVVLVERHFSCLVASFCLVAFKPSHQFPHEATWARRPTRASGVRRTAAPRYVPCSRQCHRNACRTETRDISSLIKRWRRHFTLRQHSAEVFLVVFLLNHTKYSQ
jgi:hypothetical protein